jgi:hypothetical protein
VLRPCEPPGTSFCLTLPVLPVPRRECGNCVTGARRLPLGPLVFGTSSIRFSSRWTKTPAVLRGLRSTVRVWGSRIHRSDSRSGSRVLLLRAARTSPNETPSRPPMTRAMANCGPPPWRKSQTELLRRRRTSVLLRKLRGQQLSSSRRRNGNNTFKFSRQCLNMESYKGSFQLPATP